LQTLTMRAIPQALSKTKRRRRDHELAQHVREVRLRSERLVLGRLRNRSFLAPQAVAQQSGAALNELLTILELSGRMLPDV
jgi:hypothetical protein